MAIGGVAERTARTHEYPSGEAEQLAPAVQAHLSVAGMQGMPMEDHDPPPLAARKRLQSLEEIELLRGAVRRIVVAGDEFPAAGAFEHARRLPDAGKRLGEQALLVERRDDDRQLQARCFLKCATVRSQDSLAAASL